MWDIYYIYWVLSGYIQQYSRLNLGFFFSSSACGLGRKKKFLGFGAILLYIALKNPIYTLHIYIYMQSIYGVLEGYIQQCIPPRPRFFTSEVESRGRHDVPEGTTFRPRDSTEEVKTRGQGGYVVGYSSTRPHTYNI